MNPNYLERMVPILQVPEVDCLEAALHSFDQSSWVEILEDEAEVQRLPQFCLPFKTFCPQTLKLLLLILAISPAACT